MTKNIKTSWDLSPLLPQDGEKGFEKEREKIKEANHAFINKWKDRTDYLEDPKVLKEALDEYEELIKDYSPEGYEGYYYHLSTSLDQNDPELKAKETKNGDFATKLGNELQFFTIRLSKISPNKQKIFVSSPELKVYRHFLERLFIASKYILSEPEEKILNLTAKSSSSSWVQMVSGFLSKEQREVINEEGRKTSKSFSEIQSLLNSSNKAIRDSAAIAFNDILEKHKESATAEINAILYDKKVRDELRGYMRPDKERHIADDIDSKVVDALIDTVEQNNHIAQRFYVLKAKLFGVEKLEFHERNVEYGKLDKSYSFPDAVQMVDTVFTSLDSKFSEIFQRFLEKGQIDVFPKLNKTSGAFCSTYHLSEPTYVLLNFGDKLLDVTTIAHEMGHAINSEMMRAKENELNFGSVMATAEVASNFMEDFILEEILKSADDELKLALMVSKVNDLVSSIFRQIACYTFEQDLHNSFREKGYLSSQEIGGIFQKHMAAYMGPSVEQSKGSENWWVYWPHIRNYFYVYSYASGLLIAKSMQASVKENHEFIEKVKEFLSAGLSASPKDIFAKMDIDITDKSFWEKGVKEVETLLNDTEALAKKLGKID